jgi:hypothetical protein
MKAMLHALTRRQAQLCPYCFEHFQLATATFRCASPAAQCAPVVDPVLQREWSDIRLLGKVLPAGGRFADRAVCGDCGKATRKRLCPHCHSDLPHTVGSYRNYVFAVIGAKDTGKSHYIAVLIDQIKKRIGPQMGLLLEPMNDDTIRRYRQDFYEPVYTQGRTIELTKSAMADRRVQRPMIYSLTRSGTNLFGRESRQAAVMVFFDTAGEDLNDEDVMSTVNKYIYRADGILLLVDPLQLPEVRNDVRLTKDGTALPEATSETADIMTRTTRLIERGRQLGPREKIPIPLAVAFSKFDAVIPLTGEQCQLNSSSRHAKGFDLADFEAVDGEMRDLLSQWGGADLVHQVTDRYPRHGFFGLSALGSNPHKTGKITRVLPRRVEDPFLWLLYQNGLIARVRA